eukprot:19878-Heterococcus_DN1.PRE.1
MLFEWAVRIAPESGDGIGYLWQAWSKMEMCEGNIALAANYISRAVLADSKDWQAWSLWADLEEQRGATA